MKTNAIEGRRTLLFCFYAGHGAEKGNNGTVALLNSNPATDQGPYNLWKDDSCLHSLLEFDLRQCAKLLGAYVISLFACDRVAYPAKPENEEPVQLLQSQNSFHSFNSMRGGTERGPVKDQGQGIFIHAVPESSVDGHIRFCKSSLAKEFLEQLKSSEAPNGCIMLPGNLQYWKPCKFMLQGDYNMSIGEHELIEKHGTKDITIEEPIHFSGVSPGAQSTSPLVATQDDP